MLPDIFSCPYFKFALVLRDGRLFYFPAPVFVVFTGREVVGVEFSYN